MRTPRPTSRAARARTRLNAESLEDRSVPSVGTSFVDDNWHVITDVGPAGLSVGDTVRNDNDTINPGGVVGVYGTDAFSSINDAITNTTTFGIVNVLEGTYSEQVTVNKTLTLRGAEAGIDATTRTGAETIIDASGNGGNTPVYVTANNVVLDGFTIQGNTNPNNFGFGVLLGAGTSGSQVRNNIIQNNIVGLSLANADANDQTVISHNLFRNNNQPGPASGTGIYTDQFNAGGTLSNVLIDSNSFVGQSDAGVDFSSTDATKPATNITISNNNFDSNGRGLVAFNLTASSISNNTFSNSTDATTADIRLFEGVNGLTITNNLLENGAGRAVRISNAGTGSPDATNISFNYNSVSGYTGSTGTFEVDNYSGTLNASSNWWGAISGPTIASNPGGLGQTLVDPGNQVIYRTSLVYGTDANTSAPGFQLPTAITVTAGGDISPADNDYTRLANAITSAVNGQTITLSGTFNWTSPFAAAAWALGNDGIAGNDDYSISVRPGVNNVTVTAASLGAATIQGPGDLPNANLEGVFAFNGGPNATDDNQGWTISNLAILDFDLSIGMFNSGAGADAFNNTTITNNHIRIATDLNDVAAPADVNQNIGINYSFGTNQTISNNLIEIPGNGVSDPSADLTTNRAAFSSSVGIQSNTSGGSAYNGLLITGNTIRVLNAENPTNPERIIGIWENGQANSSNITVSNNQFLNNSPANNPTTNLEQAFWITSHSSATTTVTYSGNTVQGANIGFKWLGAPEFPGQNFAGNQAVVLSGNTLTNVQTGFLVQSNGLATFTGNTVTGTPTGTGIEVLAGSIVSVLGGSFTNTGVGIDVNGGTALIQNANLNNDSVAGLRVQNGAQVDAGGGNYTGLGTSTGHNDFSSYLPGSARQAIIDLNTDAGFTGTFTAAPPDVRAQNNIFASASPAFIEQVVNHDVDVPTHGFVDFSNATAVAVTTPPSGTPPETVSPTPPTPHVHLFAVSGPNGFVTVYNADGSIRVQGNPFGSLATDIRVAVGDLNGDGVDDIVIAVGSGQYAGLVAGFDGKTLASLGSFSPFPGVAVNVAIGDVNGDGHNDLVVAAASGAAIVQAYDVSTGTLLADFNAFPALTGGATLAVANLDGVGPAEIIVGLAKGPPIVAVYNAAGQLRDAFLAYQFPYSGGINVAAGDVIGSDGLAEILVGPAAGGASGLVELFAFGQHTPTAAANLPLSPSDTGVRVGINNVDGNGDDLIFGAGPGGSQVLAFNLRTQSVVRDFDAFPGDTGGVFVD